MNTFFYKDIAYPDGVIGGKDYYNPVIYSTNERLIGVGENNKPLYQKTVISNTLAAETGETVLTGIDSLKILSLRTNTTYPFYISTYNVGGSGTEYGMVRLDSNGNVLLYNASRAASVVIEAVLQYTKTADTAGSAPYNNYGVPTVHYTTDEQVIGTWTDGKTLYRRNFYPNLTVTDNAWTNNILGTTGVNIKRCEGYFNLGSSSEFPFSYYRGSSEYFTWFINNGTDISVRPNMNAGTPIIIGRVIIEYTKTTD